jgi:tetratricopeptide (TPR) repeat protein
MPHTAYAKGLKLSAQGRHLDAINQYEQALANDPADPKILFALGNTAQTLGMGQTAEQFFRQVLALDPARTEAIVNLANLLRTRGQFEAAIALLEPALTRAPASPEMNLTLGSAWREMGKAVKAKTYYAAALAARPDYAPALANMADLLCDEGTHDEALALYDRAVRLEPSNSQIRLNRAILHLLGGSLKEGWRDYAARVALPGKVPVAELRAQPWTGGPLKGKRMLVRAEQGVGDQILFASTIPDLADRAATEGGSIILECEPRLAALFARSFPGIRVMPARTHTKDGSAHADYGWLKAVGGANCWTLMGTLPRYLRPRLDSFPAPHTFLVPDANAVARFRQLSGPGRSLGLCWRSGKGGGHRAVQYAPLASWGAFLRALPPHTADHLVSVQYDATPDEIAELEQISGRTIFVPPGLDQKNDLDATSALLCSLDAVVSAPTAVSWLAAGLGTPTWKVLYDTSWTALGQSYEPFAPACRLVMPQKRGDWADTFAQAARALTESA